MSRPCKALQSYFSGVLVIMQLPNHIIAGLNLELSRHKEPSKLDWQHVYGVWRATEGDKTFEVVHSVEFGFVIAEKKNFNWTLGMQSK